MQRSLLYSAFDPEHFRAHILSVEDQAYLRASLHSRGLVLVSQHVIDWGEGLGVLDLPTTSFSCLSFLVDFYLDFIPGGGFRCERRCFAAKKWGGRLANACA